MMTYILNLETHMTLIHILRQRTHVKEEAFSCSTTEDGEPDVPLLKKKKDRKKEKHTKSFHCSQFKNYHMCQF